jgi:hypothetical protein
MASRNPNQLGHFRAKQRKCRAGFGGVHFGCHGDVLWFARSKPRLKLAAKPTPSQAFEATTHLPETAVTEAAAKPQFNLEGVKAKIADAYLRATQSSNQRQETC